MTKIRSGELKSRSAHTELRPTKILANRPSTASRLPILPNAIKDDDMTNNVVTELTTENQASFENKDDRNEKTEESEEILDPIPDVYKTQGTITYSSCTGYSETTCLCSSIEEKAYSTNSKRVTYLERRNWITTERLCELRKKAQDAIKHHKTFTIRGCFYSIRKGLMQRGWVEKLDIHRRNPVNGSCQVVLEDVTQNLPLRRPGETRRQHIQKCERNIMSRFLEHMPIDFLWSARKEKTDWIDMARNPNLTINKFHKSPFTTKEGLCNVLRDMHWFFEEGKSETYYPRSYNTWNQEDLAEFCDDYRLTACMSMLRVIVENCMVNEKSENLCDDGGPIPLSAIRFAIKQCQSFIESRLHLDIDEDIERIWDHDWEIFLMHFQMLTQEGLKFHKPDDLLQWKVLIEEARRMLTDVAEHWPQCNLDGVLNIWIVKPSNRCRGRGIHLMNDLKKIVNHVNPPVVNKGRYVVQKYIERPMTIHNCKFDIRQWFLVTSVQPLVIWMYKESYLRFSSQEYDLKNFHESVHLTNYAVQKRYENGKRDGRLPRENMWDCHTFQAYLRQIGKASMWSERIYPGMQKALIGTMLASQDTMDRRMNTFELFGADFMISEDCQPWLIEINSSPDLGASTSVTARLCPQCLEDVIKVIVDYRNDPKSPTGGFELIYRQMIPPAPAYLGLNLFLKGTQITSKTGKKEKSKSDVVKAKNERRNSHVPNQATKPQLNTETSAALASIPLSPRPLVVDFVESTSNNTNAMLTDSPQSARKHGLLKSISQLKKTQDGTVKENCSPRAKVKLQTANHRGITRLSDVLKETLASKKATSKAKDSARRHASCGPRLMSVNAQTDDSNQNEDHSAVNTEVNELKCVGNKCGPDSETDTNNNLLSAASSPRKPSLDTPRSFNIRARLKPLNSLTRTNTSKVHSISTEEKSKTAALLPNTAHCRKYLAQSNLQLNKLPPKLPINDRYYNSHFFAVGLSMRALRSKYSRMLNANNASKVPLAQSYGTIKNRNTKNA